MAYCILCGNKLNPDDVYCRGCGHLSPVYKNAHPPPAPPKPAVPPPAQPPEQKKSGCGSWLVGIIAVAFIIQQFWPSPGPINTVEPLDLTTTPPTISVTTPPPTTAPVITAQPLITVSPAPIQSSSQVITRYYQWTFKNSVWTWDFSIPQSLYDYYKSLPRPPTENYSIYVTHPDDDLYIDALVTKIKQAAQSKGYSEYETVEFAATFVQSLAYTSDSVTTGFDEYPRYPIETLVDYGGDCEDTSILMASIVEAMNYGVVLLIFDPPAGSNAGHMAVGIKGGDNVYGSYWNYAGSKYFYLETTGDNWSIGEVPVEYSGRSARIYAMIPVPILTHEWTGSGRGIYADLKIVVTNLGTAEALGVYVYAGFDAGNDLLWNPEKSSTFNLGIGQSVIITLSIKVPVNVHTRVCVQISYGGYAVDQSYSEWFDT